MIQEIQQNEFRLKKVFFASQLPKELEPLQELAFNLWWSWNYDATELFRSMVDEKAWADSGNNPIVLLEEMNLEKAKTLLSDHDFMDRLGKVYAEFRAYIEEYPVDGERPFIGYFSMEYGLHTSVRLYSGGLGVLAGDFLKEASDSNVRMVAVGLLYRYGYFQQSVSLHGDQIHEYVKQEFAKLPIVPVRDQQGDWMKIAIHPAGRPVTAKIWEMKVGRISLYLLDTDIEENQPEDRTLTYQLYGGDNEYRLKQEILLGIGGIRALKAMNIQPDLYHCNEGHAAFLGLERLREIRKEYGMDFREAIEAVRASALFTTHTPVPAGHDKFSESLMIPYFSGYIRDLGISWEDFMALGRNRPSDRDEPFSMSNLAIRLSQEVNGVSKLHGEVSRNMFVDLFPGYSPEELFIGHVTNSVHYPTWVANIWHRLYSATFGGHFLHDQSNKEYWRKIHQVPDSSIAAIRHTLKKKLLNFVRTKIQADLTRRGEKPGAIFEVLKNIQEKALVIGFARRFATYKRARLLFTNLERLSEIVNQKERPVLFLFSGKAHPADKAGQQLIKDIITISQRPEFVGKVLFLEGYNMEIARLMVQGVDIWLNTPTRPKEASGTSGMKAAMNGVLNFSVLDGWWAEGYRPDAGWALPQENTYLEEGLQDELDAETVYNILESEIIPDFFEQDENGLPAKWIGYIRNIIAEVAPDFTMKRMLDDYMQQFYLPMFSRSRMLLQDRFSKAREIAAWKEKMKANWEAVQVENTDMPDTENYALTMGEPFKAKIKLYLNGIEANHIGLEAVFFKRRIDNSLELKFVQELELKDQNDHTGVYECHIDPGFSGVYEYGFRLFPKHEWLPHRQDLPLVRWL